MFTCPPCSSKTLPKEYRAVAQQLFPQNGFPAGNGPELETASAFAALLGVGAEYRKLFDAQTSELALKKSLVCFQNNLDLLIQKTWVEKADEERKGKLLDEVPSLVAAIEYHDYPRALEEFAAILEGLAYLFFGTQSQKDDFAEYVLRIDEQLGLFWWYGGQLKAACGASWVQQAQPRSLQALLFLGICYLTNF